MKSLPFLKKRPSLSNLEILELSSDAADKSVPVVVYFALSAESSLTLDPFNQPVLELAENKVRCLSFTLPHHLRGDNPQDAMHKWAESLLQNPHFLDNYVQAVIRDLEYLEREGVLNLNKTALMGLSRGGYIALRVAAELSEIGATLAFAPLTGFPQLAEFQERFPSALMQAQSLTNFIPKLAGKTIKILIGNRDTRVGTRASFEFMEALVEECFSKGIRTPPVEMTVTPSIGHKGHGTSPDSFKEGARWLKSLF
ncbi:alpha/beta fold hydrolase [Estrella lausannensis]|uniref:Peptidase S9 prolyl oligopeptidase catalytic domain-containing protein n=1 Tax=Estrella lausannensis TaxID=483423 RepID=A0A0H5DRD5_9BACT|nr:alpha/beta fold hydrolase [Estrella lausannensis]CRX39142.1 Conserved hypothetical protein [Estrella lausannensis]